MLNNTGIGHLIIGIVHNRISLIVPHIKHFCLKTQGTVLQLTIAVIIKFIDHTGKKDLICLCSELFSICKEIRLQANLDTLQKLLDNTGIAALRNTLIGILKIVIIIGVTKRKSLDNKGRKFLTLSSPLLAGIALYQLLVHILSHQRQCLLFQVLRVCDVHTADLLLNLRLRLCRSPNSPELMECIHIKRKVIQFILIHRNR